MPQNASKILETCLAKCWAGEDNCGRRKLDHTLQRWSSTDSFAKLGLEIEQQFHDGKLPSMMGNYHKLPLLQYPLRAICKEKISYCLFLHLPWSFDLHPSTSTTQVPWSFCLLQGAMNGLFINKGNMSKLKCSNSNSQVNIPLKLNKHKSEFDWLNMLLNKKYDIHWYSMCVCCWHFRDGPVSNLARTVVQVYLYLSLPIHFVSQNTSIDLSSHYRWASVSFAIGLRPLEIGQWFGARHWDSARIVARQSPMDF